jgi:hypothetical protein
MPSIASFRIAWMATLLLAAALFAQSIPSTGGITDSLKPEILRRDLTVINGALRLENEQQVILSGLFDDYEEAFATAAAEVRTSLAAAYAGAGLRDPESRQLTRDLFREEIIRLTDEMRARTARLGSGEDEASVKAEYHEEMSRLRALLRDSASSRADLEQRAAAREDLRRLLEGWDARRRELRDGFGIGVAAILDDEQRARWPAIERSLQRQRWLGRGYLSGESVDLADVVRDQKLGAARGQSLAPILDEWERAVDEALAERESIVGSTRWPLQDAMEKEDFDTATTLLSREMQARRAVRDLNDSFADRMCAALAAGDAERLRAAVLERGFSRVFRKTSTRVTLERAAALEGLDPAIAQSVLALAAAYQRDLDPINQRMVIAVRAVEPDLPVRSLQTRTGDRAGSAPDPRAAVTAERRALDDRYEAALESLLDPDDLRRLSGYRPQRTRPSQEVIQDRMNRLRQGRERIPGRVPGRSKPDRPD